jgi:hypothetical protein
MDQEGKKLIKGLQKTNTLAGLGPELAFHCCLRTVWLYGTDVNYYQATRWVWPSAWSSTSVWAKLVHQTSAQMIQ